MHASTVYLLILLGISLGVALGGLLGGLVGGVGFFLLHRVYVLSKRLSDIDKRLLNLDDVLSFAEGKPAPSSEAANTVDAMAASVVAPDAPLAEPRSSVPVPPDTEAIAALNTTLQALLPVLKALKVPEVVPSLDVKPKPLSEPIPPQATQAAHVTDIRNEPWGSMDKSDVSENATIANAIERILLDALRNPTSDSLPQNTERQAPAPVAPHVIVNPSLAALALEPLSTRAELAPYQAVDNDLERLKDELSTLMNDVASEHARQSQTGQGQKAQSQAVNTPPTEGATVDARSMQELLIELRKLTAQIPPAQG